MRGILGWGVHLPHGRLDRAEIAPVAGSGGGRGTRSVASYDEDTTTMGVEAVRAALRAGGVPPGLRALWFATAAPVYQDRTNAAAIHAATRLPRPVPAFDVAGAVRSAVGALDAALAGAGVHVAVASDLRTGRPGSGDEAAGGDAAVAFLIGDGAGAHAGVSGESGEKHGSSADRREEDPSGAAVLAELIARAGVTEEFLDRWRAPGDQSSKTWEERFGETRYLGLGLEAWEAALAQAGLTAGAVDLLAVAGLHERAVASFVQKAGVVPDRIVDALAATVGNPGAAQPALLLASALEQASPGQTIALVVLADGADVFLWRTTPALATYQPSMTVADRVGQGRRVPYGRYLAWRGFLPVEPPRRPEPARASAPAASRSAAWKFGLVGSEREDGSVHLPPSAFDVAPHAVGGVLGTVVTHTVDRLAWSPSPPVVFAVVDFDGGGRLPVELTDVDPDGVAMGTRVEAVFRRLGSADGVHNYFWKARPVPMPTSHSADASGGEAVR